MFSLLIAAIIGTVFAFLATQNTVPVSIHLGSYSWSNIPLFVVAIVSLLVGLIISWLLSIVNWAFSSMTIRSKEVRAQKAETSINQLQKRIVELENRNTELETKLQNKVVRDDVDEPSPLHRLTHSFSH
jgi:uncharacterized integral membrane protein